MLNDDLRCAIQLIFGHADLFQGCRRLKADREVAQALRGVLRSQSIGDDAHGFRRGIAIECRSVWKNHGVNVRVPETEEPPSTWLML